MNNQKRNPNDVEFLRPLAERPDLEPDAQFVNDLRRRLRVEAVKAPKRGRFAGFGLAAITILTAAASIFLLLNAANGKPEELSKGDPGETPTVTAPADLGPPIHIESTEQVTELFSINYGNADREVGVPQKMKGGSDLTPMSFFVKDDIFYILDNSGKKIVVTDGGQHLQTIQLGEDAGLKDLFVDNEDNIYVLDDANRAVLKFDKDGKRVGTYQIERDSFIPTSVTVNEDEDILVHQSSDITFNIMKDEVSPYHQQFGDTLARTERVSETEGRLIITESGKDSVIDIPFEDTYGALTIYDVNSKQVVYEKLEVKDESPISTFAHIYVSDRTGNYVGAVRIPTELSTYYAEHRIRVEDNQIFFMSPEEDGVHFYQLKPGAEKPVINDPIVEDEPIVENEPEVPVKNDPPVENEAIKPYLTKDFLNELRKGNMPGSKVKIGSTLTEMKNIMGEPKSIGELEGGYFHDYGTYRYIQPAIQDTIVGIQLVIKADGVTGEDFAKAWGKPISEGYLVQDEAYVMSYEWDERDIISLEMQNDRNGPVSRITIFRRNTE